MFKSALLLLTFVLSIAKSADRFPLNVIMVEGTEWKDEEVTRHIHNVQKIFKSCDLEADPVVITKISPPFGYMEFDSPKDQEIAATIPAEITRPVVFFMNGNEISQAYGANDFAEGSPRGVLHETAWISRVIQNQDYLKGLNPTYDPVAHEIAHILCDCGHIEGDEPNLLSGNRNSLSSDLTPEQCDTFRKSPLVKKKRPDTDESK